MNHIAEVVLVKYLLEGFSVYTKDTVASSIELN